VAIKSLTHFLYEIFIFLFGAATWVKMPRGKNAMRFKGSRDFPRMKRATAVFPAEGS
jgi:hypothetical protein